MTASNKQSLQGCAGILMVVHQQNSKPPRLHGHDVRFDCVPLPVNSGACTDTLDSRLAGAQDDVVLFQTSA